MGERSQPRAGASAILLIAAVGGAGTMVVELAAVRLLAPWFGTSQSVWTNVIGVVLLALSMGYLVGGRLANGRHPLRTLGMSLVLAGLSTAWLPTLTGVAARWFLPAGVALHEAAGLVLWGSLATSMLLFFPPAFVLGTVAPLAVEAVSARRGVHAGQAGGAVLSYSTLGSLAGVFGTSHLLLPSLGLGGSFLLASGVLVGAGVAALWLGRSAAADRNSAGQAPLALLLVSWAAALGWSRTSRPALPEPLKELAYAESAYQSLRVIEDPTVDPPMRMLQVNESFDSFQSVWQRAPGLLPRGFYYNDFALPLAWSDAEAQGTPRPWRVLILGLGAGTAYRVLEGARPAGRQLEVTGVELDASVLGLAERFFDLPTDSVTTTWVGGLDARVALRQSGQTYDQVILDCYANQVEIPPHLCTLEFFTEVRDVLSNEGWLSANLGGFGVDDPVVQAVAKTCAAAFGQDVLLMPVPSSRNLTLLAREGGRLPTAPSDGPSLSLAPANGPASRLLAPRVLPGSWKRLCSDAGRTVLTDDRCPIEALQRRSLREGLARLRRDGAG